MPKKALVQPHDPKRYMGYPDAAAYTQLSQRKLAELVSQKLLKVIRCGKRVLFDSRDLDNFLAGLKR